MKAEKLTAREQSRRSRYGMILLLLVLFFLFVVPFFPISAHKFLHNTLLTGILIFTALSVDRARRRLFVISLAVIVIEWLTFFLQMPSVQTVSQVVLFIYFILIVISLIAQVAKTSRVTVRVIVESINGYLLMGIVFSLIMAVLTRNNASAYSFGGVVSSPGPQSQELAEFIYYGFVTYTTLGYGDVVPLLPVSKSIAVLASVTGQMYLTVIIAMLVGKFLGSRQKD